MATDKFKIVVDEIRETIRQTFDDKLVSRAQAAYWVIIVGNRLLGQHISKRDSGKHLSIFTSIPIEKVASSDNHNIIKGRKFITLPKNIFDFDKDGGVEYIAYYDPDERCEPEFAKKVFQRTTPSELQLLNLNDMTKPSAKNPYWFLVEDGIIYLVGIEKTPARYAEIGIYATIDPLETIDLDKPFPFPQELLEQVKRQVVDLARYSFLFPGTDRSNDGDDTASDTQNKTIPKINSVNDQNNSQ